MNKGLFLMLLIAFFAETSLVADENEFDTNKRIYDCAANSLYILCKLSNKEVSYQKCLEYLPLTKNGNNMLEFKKALENIGYIVNAKIIDAKELRNMKKPCIVLRDAIDKNDQKKNQMGHFFVILPRFENKEIGIYDYPAKPQILPVELLISTLEKRKIARFPILLCDEEDYSDRQVLKPANTEISEENQNSSNGIIIKDTSLNRFTAKIDFGELPEGSLYKGYFKIKNLSKELLVLKYLKADCKCTDITCDKKILQPEEEAEICTTVSLVQKYNSVTVNGYAVFEYNEGQILVQLLIKGISQPRWICKPQKIDFGDIDTEELCVTKQLVLENTLFGKNSKITRIEPDSSFLIAEKIVSDDKTCIFDVTLKPLQLSGAFSSKINIYLNNESTPATYFDITGIVKKDFIVVPERILLKTGKIQKVLLYHHNRDNFEVKSISLTLNDNDCIAVTQLPSASNELILQLNANNIPAREVYKNNLSIQVNQKGKIYSVSIPVICTGI